jgi:hypothetical protein
MTARTGREKTAASKALYNALLTEAEAKGQWNLQAEYTRNGFDITEDYGPMLKYLRGLPAKERELVLPEELSLWDNLILHALGVCWETKVYKEIAQ